jgi:hypothetical protein
MVLTSAVTPAPEDGSNPPTVRTIGGVLVLDIAAIYPKSRWAESK